MLALLTLLVVVSIELVVFAARRRAAPSALLVGWTFHMDGVTAAE